MAKKSVYTLNFLEEFNYEMMIRTQKAIEYIQKLTQEGKVSKDKTIEDFDTETFFRLAPALTPQAKSPLTEKFLGKKLGWEKISAKLDKGDFKTQEGKFVELKVSYTNLAEQLNIKQIRLYQKDVDYYVCIYIDDFGDLKQDSRVFLLTKEQMEQEVEQYGSFTHGTTAANKNNQNHEYSLVIPIKKEDDKKTKYWLENYRSLELERLIFGDD